MKLRNQVEEIVVTAEKRSASLQDTPISITAFDEDDLLQMGVHEIGQIGVYTPNVQINKIPGSNDNFSLSIRGIAASDATSLLTEPTVGLYVDGVYIARSTGNVFDLVDLERVEVLRGPQGTLYGRNTIGGAINLISVKPGQEFSFKQQLNAGNRGYFYSNTSVDTGAFGDFSGKLSYVHNERDGLLKNSIYGGDLGEYKSDAYRAALRWTPGENVILDYVFDKSDRTSNASILQIVKVKDLQTSMGGAIYKQAQAQASQKRLGQLPIAFFPGDDVTSDIEGHALTLEWAMDTATFKSITSYRDWKSSTPGNDFGSFQSDGVTVLDGAGGVVPQGDWVSVFMGSRISAQDQFTQEFSLIGSTLNDRLQYTVGLYYFEESTKEHNPQTFILPGLMAYGRLPAETQAFLCQGSCYGKDAVLNTALFSYGSEVDSTAVYGQFTYALNEKIDLTLGLRYTEDDKSVFLKRSGITSDDGLDKVKAAKSWTNFNPSFKVSYAWNEDLNMYLSYTNGYRSGGFNARSTTAEDFQTAFDEENVDSYEFGLKSEWFESRLRINMAVFHVDYEDAQVSQFKAGSGGASSVVSNAGELQTEGLEVEITAIPVTGLTVTAAYGYVDAKYTEFLSPLLDPDTGLAISDNIDISNVAKVANAPKNTGSVVVQYDFQPFSFGQLTARIDGTYVGKRMSHAQLNKYNAIQSQELINARLTLSQIPVARGNLLVAAWGKNLGNKKYREWGIDFGALGFATNTFQEMSSYGVDVIYKY